MTKIHFIAIARFFFILYLRGFIMLQKELNQVFEDMKEDLKENEKILGTTKELSNILDVDVSTIVRNAEKCLPNKRFENGDSTLWTESEVSTLITFMKGNRKDSITTKELANILGVSVRTIQNAVERLGLANVLTQVKIRGQNAYVFNESQSTLIKQEIQKHHNLAIRQIDNVTTEEEENKTIASAIMILQRRADSYKQRAEIAESQVKKLQKDLHTFTKSNDVMLMRDVAKVLGYKDIGEKKLYSILRQNNILMANNMPYQKYMNCGYFQVSEYHYTDNNEKTHISYCTKVTQNGILFISTVLDKFCNNNEV